MRADYLRDLKKRYGPLGPDAPPDPLEPLLRKYREYRSATMLDIAAVATQLSIDELRATQVDPLVDRAIAVTNPGFDRHALHSDEEWAGVVNSAKGKYFEFLVEDRLNRGEPVGDVVLPPGYEAHLADSMTQPGWDLKILDEHGRVDEYLQLKVTDSTAYIREALERYPDIKVLASSEVADGLDGSHMVLDAGTSEDELRAAVLDGVGGQDGFIDAFWDAFHPLLPLLLIAGTGGYQVAIGRRTLRDAAEVATARAQRALVTAGIGAIVKAMGGGWLAIPATILAGIWVTEIQTVDELIARVRASNRRLSLQALVYSSAGGR